MITLGIMKWSNVFSYASDNFIDFNAAPITQLVGLNGHGKSSIAMILELVLFNKNSKGAKAGRILNRYVEDTFYTISLTFTKDSDEYAVSTKRASTQTVKVIKNGEDISAHTATASFKLIEEILGFDHKTFCQLVYQSSAQSLEFLSATDTNRKKFLIDLLSLEKYGEAFEIFKSVSKEVQKEVDKHSQSVAVITGWIDKNKNADLVLKPILPLLSSIGTDEMIRLRESIRDIDKTNKAIETNNTYKTVLDSIDLSALPVVQPYENEAPLVKSKTEYEQSLKTAKAFIAKVNSLKHECPTCGHELDNSKQLELVDGTNNTIADAEIQIRILSEKISKIQANNKILTQNAEKTSRWEQYHALYNPELKAEILDKNDLEARLVQVETEITNRETEIKKVRQANELAIAHNAKIEVIKQQMTEMQIDLVKANMSLESVNIRLTNLQILQKAFSTNGLVAFKIESMVKDLEELVNHYLAELSYGRFQLSFVISGEKLNVIICDNGLDVEMTELSAGEKARVNTATLLAIRKLMQQLSNTKINVLILDETIDNLDLDGKEKLIELLLAEDHLNTFLISHGFTHPLLEKLDIIKEDNISRIE